MSNENPAEPRTVGDDKSGEFTRAETEPGKESTPGPETDTTAGAELGDAGPTAAGTAEEQESEGTDESIVGADENMPPVPEEIREAGRQAPDHWLGMVDPTWTGEDTPPDWAMVGRWRSGLDGEIVEWQDNEEYRPSPRALGWPEPADAVDAAVQLAATGYGPGEDVVKTLAYHEVGVFVTPDGGPLAATTPDDTSVVPVFTSPVYLHAAGRLAFELMKVPDLLDLVPEGHRLYLNPSGPVSMEVELDVLREQIGGQPARDTGADSDDDPAPAASRPERDTPALPRSRPVTTVSLDGPEGDSSPGAADAVSEVLSGTQTEEQTNGNGSGDAPGTQKKGSAG